jgi:hypothetical protein
VRTKQFFLQDKKPGVFFILITGLCMACGGLLENAHAATMAMGVYRGLPKTGQTASYQAADDGDYEKGWSGTRHWPDVDSKPRS